MEQGKPQLVTAFEALQILERRMGSAVVTKAEIADRLRDARLGAYADEIWRSPNPSLYEAWREVPAKVPDIQLELNVEVDPWVWRWSEFWLEDQSNWRWNSGMFSITKEVKPIERVMLRGVKFVAAEIAALAGTGPLPPHPVRGKGGRPSKDEAWTSLLHSFIELAQAGELTRERFSTQLELRNELLDRISYGLSEGSITSEVRQVWNKFVEAPSRT